jgi:hypothetical protein
MSKGVYMKEKVAEFINIVYGFRKTLLVLILYVVGILFRLRGLIDGGQMVDLFKGITIAFMTANSFEHMTETVKTYINSKGQTVTDAEPEVAEGGPAGDPQAASTSK